MKTELKIIFLFGYLTISCECDNDDLQLGAGLEIYRVDTVYTHYVNNDYSMLDLDTIAIEDTPILRYEDLIKYDTSTHKLTLGISHDSLKAVNPESLYGNMFMVTLDSDPIYCGWYWWRHISMPCNWVYMNEPFYELDSLEDNEIVISFRYNYDYWQKNPDPRLDSRIVERLAKDGKIE